MSEFEVTVNSLSETEEAGRELANYLNFPSCVYLNGEMGAGKTTLSKSIINALGYSGDVTSPTYNLIQEYPVTQGIVYHMDLYRLKDASELEYLAIEDLWSNASLFLVEWPDKGGRYLRPANFEIVLRKIFDKNQDKRHIILKSIN